MPFHTFYFEAGFAVTFDQEKDYSPLAGRGQGMTPKTG